jgi:hypothetical protein
MNLRLRLDPPIRIEDMVFNLEDMKNQTTKTHYRIAWKVNLP